MAHVQSGHPGPYLLPSRPLCGAHSVVQCHHEYTLIGKAKKKKNNKTNKQKQSGEKVNLSRGLFCEVVVVQLLSHVRLLATPWTAECQVSLSFTISPSLLKLMSTGLMMSSNHHLSPTSHPALNLSQHQGLFQRVSSSHQVSKVLKL